MHQACTLLIPYVKISQTSTRTKANRKSIGSNAWKMVIAHVSYNALNDPNPLSEDFSLLVTFLLVTFAWLFRSFFVAFSAWKKKQCLGVFRAFFAAFPWLFRGFSVAFSWPSFWANVTRTRPGKVFWPYNFSKVYWVHLSVLSQFVHRLTCFKVSARKRGFERNPQRKARKRTPNFVFFMPKNPTKYQNL